MAWPVADTGLIRDHKNENETGLKNLKELYEAQKKKCMKQKAKTGRSCEMENEHARNRCCKNF